MSTKSSLLLTADNEHWYYEGSLGQYILEIDNEHERQECGSDKIEIIVKRRSALEKELNIMAYLPSKIMQLRESLEYAIKEADGWCDESRGTPVNTPEMDKARKLISGINSLP